ncbi:MAG: tyrosine-type recombinase/integrase [Clostridiales bacterium]|nr:tyrosine-type recombinase/integrase [Clostridiales bacterium]MDY4036090.1 tyrosine-type recombinase/integrase [Candidatus Pseudoscilispira sp.]
MASIEKRIGKAGEVSYHIVSCAGSDATGKKIRRRTIYHPEKGMTEKQADKAAQKATFFFEQKLEEGYVFEENQRFSDYADYVLELKLRNGLKRSTYERYQTLLPKINQTIGSFRLREIRLMHLNRFYAELSRPGMRDSLEKAVAIKDIQQMLDERSLSKAKLAKAAGVPPQSVSAVCQGKCVQRKAAEAIAKSLGKGYSQLFRTEKDMTPLSAKTILEYHRLVCAILSQAEKEMLVPYNAAKKATPPKQQQKGVNYFQPQQICDILRALDGEPLKWQLITHLLMITGARRGEIAGLKWSKFDMERRRLKVDAALLYSSEIGTYETTTKTGNRRYIPLPEETFALLRRYKISQLELQIANGDRWFTSDYVFTMDDGKPLRPDSITQWLGNFSRRKGLPHINPHAFRHTAASVLITQGIDIVTVSKMLGHAKVSTTEDIYSHVIEESKQLASNALADVYFRGKRREA